MDQRIVESPEKARAGRKQGVVRYILAISLALVILAFIIVYFVEV
jgi:hypothetical protein